MPHRGTVFVFVFGGRPQLVVELDHSFEVKNLYSAQVRMIVSRSVYGNRHPRGNDILPPIAASGSGHTEK